MDKQSIQYLDITQVQPNPLQPRGVITPDSIMDLVDSIKEHGILEPMVVAHTPAGFQIIAGERRWRASKMAGLTQVPCIVKETSPQGMLELAIVENVQREDLNPLERAEAFNRLLQEFNLSHADVARRVGKSPSYVSNSLKLLELPDVLKDGLLGNLISEGHARALLGIVQPSAMIEAYKQVLRETASVRRTEEIARRVKQQLEHAGLRQAKPSQTQNIVHEDIDRMQSKMQESLGGKSSVKLIRTARQTKVTFLLNGNPAQTEERLQKIFKGVTVEAV
ncbi:ParB/RepB/Spo0J family partition protein [Candidatus Beckwithbacteria bacterium]|nr:ParB/RepB/Spo0J family partition protein [Candidatus Beckwithbacteria bacterium]